MTLCAPAVTPPAPQYLLRVRFSFWFTLWKKEALDTTSWYEGFNLSLSHFKKLFVVMYKQY